MWQRLSSLPQPSIAAIDGHALGSGLELAVACDFRIAGAGATLGLPEIRIGGAPGIQVLARLPVLVGLGLATRMLLTGDTLTADEAAAAGLVHEVAPDGAAFEVAERLARRLAVQPRSSVRFLKASLSAALDASVDRVAAVADDGVEGLFQAPEMREGIAAFLEKRQPDFTSGAYDRVTQEAS
jgi:enoyl-CoA hydratase